MELSTKLALAFKALSKWNKKFKIANITELKQIIIAEGSMTTFHLSLSPPSQKKMENELSDNFLLLNFFVSKLFGKQ